MRRVTRPGAPGPPSTARGSLNFCSLPVAVRASSSRSSTVVGHLKCASRPRQCSISSASSPSRPGTSTTSALTVSPHFSSGTPMTAASATCGVRAERVLHLDRRDVLAPADDHVLLAVGDGEVALVVEAAAVAGVEPAVDDRVGGRLGLLPVALEHHVRPREHLALVVDAEPHARARARRHGRACGPVRRARGRPTRRAPG